MKILGISAYYHDSSASLTVDGKIVACAQEERFTRKKHDYGFPSNAIQFCMEEGRISTKDIDFVVFYEKPLLKFDRLLETYLSFAPLGFKSFFSAMPQWLKKKLFLPRDIKKKLKKKYKGPIIFPRHHESHAASAFFPSPYEEAAIITLDGVGEWECITIGIGKQNKIELLKSINFPHSIGLLYSAFTYFCGFRVNSGEYKLMGLAPYGEPIFTDLIYEHLIDLKEDGSFRLNLEFFNYCQGLTMTNSKFASLFGGPKRKPESKITQREMDLAASIQKVTEEIVLRLAKTAKQLTGLNNLCLSGGVALNCVANGKLIRKKIFSNIWIQPASGDAGGALGACLFTHFQLLDNKRIPEQYDSMKGARLGPSFSNSVIEETLIKKGASYKRFLNEEELLAVIAKNISEEKVVGWFNGRMEFGPRALGARSILGDARSTHMQSKMNLSIKYRESFRPFAPSVLLEDAKDYFKLTNDSPYMLVVTDINDGLRCDLSEHDKLVMKDPDLIKRVNVKRSNIPAVTHVDFSARVQTIDEHRHGRYYRLIKEFKRQTGSSVIINTSFNIRGEPIVCSPEDAIKCFMGCEMDVLVLEDFILIKTEQPHSLKTETDNYKDQFKLD